MSAPFPFVKLQDHRTFVVAIGAIHFEDEDDEDGVKEDPIRSSKSPRV